MQNATLKWSGRPLHLRIALVKTQMRKCTIAYNKGTMAPLVYYETIDELNSVIKRLREQQGTDPIDLWCLGHSRDPECREYDL